MNTPQCYVLLTLSATHYLFFPMTEQKRKF